MKWLDPILLGTSALGLLLWGPIAQFVDYHDFADTRSLSGIPNAGDVLSNLPFLGVAIWGWFTLRPHRHRDDLSPAWRGYALFIWGLGLTAFGSGYYHLAPDDARLIWDRLPIALACAGLLAGVYAETHGRESLLPAAVLGIFAVLSVAWWHYTADLRPYIWLQALPLITIPLWQFAAGRPRAERWAFLAAIALYALAKVGELYDDGLYDTLGFVSGHSLKHLLAAAAAGVIVYRLRARLGSTAAREGRQDRRDALG